MELKEDVRRLHALYQAGDYRGALQLATSLRDDDPERLAWINYYEVLCLYRDGSYALAYEELKSLQDRVGHLPPDLQSYVWYVGCELAFRLNEPEEVVAWGRRSADLRHKAGQTELAVEASRSVCEFLSALETNRAPALPFARYILAQAPSSEGASVALSTVLMLARDARSAPLLREALDRVLLDGRTRVDARGLQILAEVERIPGFAQLLGEGAGRGLAAGERYFQLCAAGQLPELREMLNLEKVHVNFQWGRERSHALQHAAFTGQTAILEFLCERGADVDSANAQGTTALMLASRQGHAKAVEVLLQKGAAPDRTNVLGQTALHLAVAGKHAAVADALLAAGAHPGADDAAGLTPWTLARGGEMAQVLGLVRERPEEAPAQAPPARGQLLHRIERELVGEAPTGVARPVGSVRPPARPLESGLCQLCLAVGPTRHFHFRTHVGAVLFYVHQDVEGELCRNCGLQEGSKAQLISLVMGWWGLYSLGMNLFCVVANPWNMLKLLRLPSGPTQPLALDRQALRDLHPHREALGESLRAGQPMREIARSFADRSGVAPEQVVQYARVLLAHVR